MSKRDDVLEAVANVAYYGGIWHDMTEAEALEEIRALVYPWLHIGWLKKKRDRVRGVSETKRHGGSMSAMMFAGMLAVWGLVLLVAVAAVWFAWSALRDVWDELRNG